MATEDKKIKKTKNKILNDQITFDFFGGELEEKIVKRTSKNVKFEKVVKQRNKIRHFCVKRNHIKKFRRIRKIGR